MSRQTTTHSSLRAWLPLLVMVLSLAFQTGCKNRKTVINQAPAPAPVAPTASTPGSTTATDTADFDDPCDPDDPDCDLDSIDPSEIPTDDFDPTDMLAGGPNITINVVNNGVIHVGDRRRRRHPRGPWWRRGEEGDLELMGGDGGHGDEGMPDADTDLVSDAGDCGSEADEADTDPGCSTDAEEQVETEPETNVVDLEANLKLARQAVEDAEELRDEAEEAAQKAQELADQMAGVTDLEEAEALLAQVLEQSTLAGSRSRAVAEKVDAIGAGIDEVERSADQDGKEEALTEARSLYETAEAASIATDEHQTSAEAAEAEAQEKVDELSAAAAAAEEGTTTD